MALTRILLDTSGYSAYRRGHPALLSEIQLVEDIFFSPVVLGELLAGFRRGGRRPANEKELSEFLESPRVAVAAVDRGTAECYAAIFDGLRRAGTPLPSNDVWIAASAMQHGLTVVTTDEHFERIPQVLVRRFPPR